MQCPPIPTSLQITLRPRANGYVVTEAEARETFSVPVATTPDAIRRGLMHREDVGNGMLFAFETPRVPSFWMKHTLVPLDMEFLDAELNLVDAHRHVQPGDLTPRRPSSPVCFVLERPAGSSVVV